MIDENDMREAVEVFQAGSVFRIELDRPPHAGSARRLNRRAAPLLER